MPSQNAPDPPLYHGVGDGGTAGRAGCGSPTQPIQTPPILNIWEEGSSASDFGCPRAVPGSASQPARPQAGLSPRARDPPQVSAAPRQPVADTSLHPCPFWGSGGSGMGVPQPQHPPSNWDAVS